MFDLVSHGCNLHIVVFVAHPLTENELSSIYASINAETARMTDNSGAVQQLHMSLVFTFVKAHLLVDWIYQVLHESLSEN